MKTAIVVVALLAGVGLLNKYVLRMDPNQLAARGVGKDAHSHGEDHAQGESEHGVEEDPVGKQQALLRPIGPEDAEVTIQALWLDPQELEGLLRPMLKNVATSYKGHVRVEFLEPETEEHARVVENITEGSRVGLVINGEMIKEVPEAPLGVLAFSGSPSMQEWSERDLRLAIEHELEANGVEFEPQVEHDHSGHARGRQSAPMPSERGGSHAGHDH
jgi:hypothetical protein